MAAVPQLVQQRPELPVAEAGVAHGPGAKVSQQGHDGKLVGVQAEGAAAPAGRCKKGGERSAQRGERVSGACEEICVRVKTRPLARLILHLSPHALPAKLRVSFSSAKEEPPDGEGDCPRVLVLPAAEVEVDGAQGADVWVLRRHLQDARGPALGGRGGADLRVEGEESRKGEDEKA